MVESSKSPWEPHWGRAYDPETKRNLLEPIFEELESAGKIGNVVVDVGSGAHPITKLLSSKPARKIIAVDIVGENGEMFDRRQIKFDAEKIDAHGTLSYKKALLRVSRFLGVNPRAETNKEHADTIIFSEILNYVDYQRVLGGFSKYLKPGGRLIVINRPGRGIWQFFHERGVKNNKDLFNFLEDHNFDVEYKESPSFTYTSDSGGTIFLVAVKRPTGGARSAT